MKRIAAVTVACALGLAGFSGMAEAHEFLVKPDKMTAGKGETLHVQAQAAHVFMISEEAESPERSRLELVQGDAIVAVPLAEDASVKALTGKVALPGDGPALLAGHRLPEIWSDTTEGVLEGDRKALESAGKKVLKVGQYEKFSKTLVNAAPGDALYGKKLGQGLEIVLLTNPADLKGGGEVKAQVLLHGKPAVASLGATYDGFSKESDAYAVKTETNDQGMATLKLDRPGLWMLRTEATEPVGKDGIDKRNLRATYVFDVK